MKWIPIFLLGLLPFSLFGQSDRFTNHGVAVPHAKSFGNTAMTNAKGERLVVIWLGDHANGVRNLLAVNLDTGESHQIPVDLPRWGTTRGFLVSERGLMYAQFANRFFEFSPDELTFTFAGKTTDRRSYALFEDDNGNIWAAQSFGAHLLRFEPESRELTDYGALNQEDWRQFARSIAGDDTGWIYVGLGQARSQIIGFNPESGEIRHFLSEGERKQGSGLVQLGRDGEVYANAPGWPWHRLSDGEATPLDEEPPSPARLKAGHPTRISARPLVDSFPDGSRIQVVDVPTKRVIYETKTGEEKIVSFDYETEGALLYTVAPGPDGDVYGGSGHPTHLFRYDPSTGVLDNDRYMRLGHINAILTRGDTIFFSNYSGGAIFAYDPDQPWDPADAQGGNPQRISETNRPEISRPSVLIAHPDGKHLVLGGTPRGGATAGGLYIHNLEEGTGERISSEDLLPDQNTMALVPLPNGNLLGATTVLPGTGGARRVEQAELYILDWQTREIIWREAILPGRESFRDMVAGPGGLVYGMAGDSTFFVFDPETRKLVHQESLSEYGGPAGSQAPRLMAFGDDDILYVLFRENIVSLDPENYDHRLLAQSPGTIGAGIAIVDGKIYFTMQKTELWSYDLDN